MPNNDAAQHDVSIPAGIVPPLGQAPAGQPSLGNQSHESDVIPVPSDCYEPPLYVTTEGFEYWDDYCPCADEICCCCPILFGPVKCRRIYQEIDQRDPKTKKIKRVLIVGMVIEFQASIKYERKKRDKKKNGNGDGNGGGLETCPCKLLWCEWTNHPGIQGRPVNTWVDSRNWTPNASAFDAWNKHIESLKKDPCPAGTKVIDFKDPAFIVFARLKDPKKPHTRDNWVTLYKGGSDWILKIHVEIDGCDKPECKCDPKRITKKVLLKVDFDDTGWPKAPACKDMTNEKPKHPNNWVRPDKCQKKPPPPKK